MKTNDYARARMDFRLPAKVKELIEQAAAMSGQSVSDFATATLTREAEQIIEKHRIIRMAQEDYDRFSAFVDAPAKPIPAVSEALKERKRRKARAAESKKLPTAVG